MGALEERLALEKAIEAARRIIFGQRQAIRKPPAPSPQLPQQGQGRGQT